MLQTKRIAKKISKTNIIYIKCFDYKKILIHDDHKETIFSFIYTKTTKEIEFFLGT